MFSINHAGRRKTLGIPVVAKLLLKNAVGSDEAETGRLLAAPGRKKDDPGRFGGDDGLLDGGYPGNAIREAGFREQVLGNHNEDTFDSLEGCA